MSKAAIRKGGHEGRLFELAPSVSVESTLPAEVAHLADTDPHAAICFGALGCIRRSQPVHVEAQVYRALTGILDLMLDEEKTAADIAYAASLSYSAETIANAFAALEKEYDELIESPAPQLARYNSLYSAAIALTQASPNMSVSQSVIADDSFPESPYQKVTSNIEVVCKIALLRADVIGGGIVNGFETVKNLALELCSDDGAIMQKKFYTSLFDIFKDMAQGAHPWIEPACAAPMTGNDFAHLIFALKKSRNVSSDSVAEIAASQPSQLTLSI